MKILHINTYDTGGAGKACLRLHGALIEQGVESKVLLRNKTQEAEDVYEIWEEHNSIVKGKKYLEQKNKERKEASIIKKHGFTGELFSFPLSIWDITAHPLYEWADIIHLHWVAGFVDYPTFFSKNKKRIVWTLHDEEPFSGGVHYPPPKSDDEYKNLIAEHLKIKETAFLNQDITVVSPSRYLKEKSSKSALFSSYNHFNIKNCTDTKVFNYLEKSAARNQLGLPLDKQIILFVADTMKYPRKGFSLLEEALTDFPLENVLLCTAGKGKINVESGTLHMGDVASEVQMHLLYAAADLFVIPSLMDNLPNTIAESLCSGTPVVGCNVGGIPEMIEPEFGLLCDLDARHLSESIKKAMGSAWNRERISELNGRRYSQKKCAEAYLEIYNSGN